MTPFAASAVPAKRLDKTRVLDDYVTFCTALQAICGIDLSQYKRPQMERRIRTFVARHEVMGDLEAYAKTIRRDKAELDRFLDRVTINVSQLWRNPDQWDRLEHAVLPELAEHGKGRVRIWSAGCSYGAEAFTLAAICRHVGVARPEITGTDIDKRIVERARAGVFSADDARDAPSSLLSRFFTAQADGRWQAVPELRSAVKFETGDLLRLPVRRHAYDLVLCRNTVIYFTDEVRDALHAKLVECLRPGGYLVVGATERVSSPSALGLAPAFPFTYRKAG